MLDRIIGVHKLDAGTFEEIEHNSSLTLPAALIVLKVSLVSGVGNGFFNDFFHKSFFQRVHRSADQCTPRLNSLVGSDLVRGIALFKR